MVPVVVTDADMLFGLSTRTVFLHLSMAGHIHVHWSQRILDEMSRALVKRGRQATPQAALAHEAVMNRAVPTAMLAQARVDLHEPAMRAFVHDPNDAHVAACAYELLTGDYYAADTTVLLTTRNLGDFKLAELAALKIQVCHPDAFLMSLPLEWVAAAIAAWRASRKSPAAPAEFLARLAKDGNAGTAAALRAGESAARLKR